MAFSMRAGTHWCHDFPKLARESGFYFNVHRAPVRIDWNRISTIDIDRVMRDRDFLTIDENVNSVVDYSLETAYDIKILDPNFVKIFRLAQLSVEYLLYCRQYLDQSVIILKDDLKQRLEETHKLRRELSSAEEQIKEFKDKSRDKYKWLEKKFSDSSGEIHKCPHCPKTFISSVFMTSHMTRRHSIQSLAASPGHEEYRAEAEKLHNEIKTLKERLNETERIIRSEPGKLQDSISPRALHSRKIESNDRQRIEEEYEKYREEMSNLRSILFGEIRSVDATGRKIVDQHDERNELVKQQGEEIQRLRDQLKNQALEISESQVKLNHQENQYWQSKIQEIERQHQVDIERLNQQLIINQQTTERMKLDYTSKIVQLEEKSRNYVDTVVQRESTKEFDPSDTERTDVKLENERRRGEIVGSRKKNEPPTSSIISSEKRSSLMYQARRIEIQEVNFQEKKTPKSLEESPNRHRSPQKSPDRSENQNRTFDGDRLDQELLEDVDADSETISESQTSETESDEDVSDGASPIAPRETERSHEETKIVIQQDFDHRLRDLGVDPEWTGIPRPTYRQLLTTMGHHRALGAKKHRNFKQTREQISEKLLIAIARTQRIPSRASPSPITKSPLNRLMSNVTSRAIVSLKALKKDNRPKLSRERANFVKSQSELLPNKIDEISIREREDIDTRKGDIDIRKGNIDTKRENFSVFSPTKFVEPRYVSSPRGPIEPLKQLFHSYESIKDYNKDSFGRFSTETTNRILGLSEVDQDSPHVSVLQGKLDQIASLPGSPKSKSLLKPMTGSVGSLVKKKVLFDLDNTEESEMNYSKSSQVSSTFENSDEGTSSASEEAVESPQDAKQQQKDWRIEVMTRQRPVGGVKLFDNEMYEEIMAKARQKVNIPPQPAPRTSTLGGSTLGKDVLPGRESNLQSDIEELLRMD
ncbi:cilium assembly protein DZIP1L [Diachasmimorpha longicaudata]|uniref:cilium assembly protein DZIP1L n=1 Tax=Diachasmimorpha longicaudata TaxID=58733 RepID=UPI0030B88927